jgi:protein TonB
VCSSDLKEKAEGVVYISFVVERDGSIGSTEVLRGVGGGCDEEALRVVRAMPDWSPGRMDGVPVRVRYNLPIRFKANL